MGRAVGSSTPSWVRGREEQLLLQDRATLVPGWHGGRRFSRIRWSAPEQSLGSGFLLVRPATRRTRTYQGRRKRFLLVLPCGRLRKGRVISSYALPSVWRSAG